MIRSFNQITPRVAPSAFVDPTAIVMGDVVLGEHSSIWPMATLRGDVYSIAVGDRTNIQDHCILHATHYNKQHSAALPVSIGNDVTVGHRVILHACTVKDRCLIGMGSTVLDGAVIHSDVIIGAGSLVSPGKIIESGYLWLGSPVKKIRPLTEEEISFLKYSADYYVTLKNQHQNIASPK